MSKKKNKTMLGLVASKGWRNQICSGYHIYTKDKKVYWGVNPLRLFNPYEKRWRTIVKDYLISDPDIPVEIDESKNYDLMDKVIDIHFEDGIFVEENGKEKFFPTLVRKDKENSVYITIDEEGTNVPLYDYCKEIIEKNL